MKSDLLSDLPPFEVLKEALLADPEDVLPAEEIAAYRAAQQSVIDARRYAEAHAHEIVI